MISIVFSFYNLIRICFDKKYGGEKNNSALKILEKNKNENENN